MRKITRNIQTKYNWITLAEAASVLRKSAAALRKMIQRNVSMGPKGVLEARLTGFLARKFQGRWLVSLTKEWT